MKLLIDGDALVYKAGFVSEKMYYDLYDEDNDVVHSYEFKPKLELGVVKRQEPKPAKYAIHNIEQMIRGYKRNFKTNDVVVYLTDSDINNNDRYKVYSKYKQNRVDKSKPLHYTNLRRYLMGQYNAEVVTGVEADDALGLAQTDDTIIISHDKDLLMIPGLHYSLTLKRALKAEDPGKLVLYRDKAGNGKLIGVGFKWFCAQLLLGDDADNIKGIRGHGPVKVYKLLSECDDLAKLWENVKSIYLKQKDWETRLNLNAYLLWIQRPNYSSYLDFIEEYC